MGATRARYPGITTVTATQVAPRYAWTQGASSGFVEGAFASFGGGWATSLAMRDAWSRGIFGSEATLEANLLKGGLSTGRLQQAVAIGHPLGPVLASAGFSGGVMRDTGGTFSPVISGRLGAASSLGALRLQRFDGSHIGRYTDAEYAFTGSRGIAAVVASAGLRAFDHHRSQATFSLQLLFQPLHFLAIGIGGGRTPPTPEGFSGGNYVRSDIIVMAAPRVVRPEISRAPAGTRVMFAMPGSEVSISGDWNDWSATPMTREADGRWSVVLPIGAGAHKFTLTVDGKTIVPRGVPKLPDGFGGEVGLLVIG